MNRSRVRLHLGVLALYTVLAVILTWPLAAHLGTHVPGVPQWAFDESTFVWNIWQFKHTVVDNLASPLHSDLIYYPLGIDLVLYTYNFYHVLAALPLAMAFNLPLASNLTLLAATVLSGYGTFLLVRDQAGRTSVADSVRGAAQQDREGRGYDGQRHARSAHPLTRSPAHPLSLVTLAAFAAGALYAFASNRAVYAALGHYDMVTTQWIPFYALMLLRTLDGSLPSRARRRAAILAGVFFAFTGLAEMISALFLGIFTVIALLVGLRHRVSAGNSVSVPPGQTTEGRMSLREVATNLALLGGVAFVLWSPALIPILLAFVNADYGLKGWGDALILSADLLGWFTPTVFHPLFGGDVVRELHLVQQRAVNPALPGFRDINTVFLGWASLLLAVVGALAWRRKLAVWIWTSVLFGLFTLGPLLQINGRTTFDLDGLATTVPLPFALLHFLPVIQANRAPNRNSVLLMLGLAVLAGYGLLWIMSKASQRKDAKEQRRKEKLVTTSAQSTPLRTEPLHPLTRSPAHPLTVTIALLATGLILFEHLALPFPLSDARIPSVYADIAADPQPGSILQLPLGWRNSFGVFGPEQTLLQYYQSAHGKPILGGNISRAPDFKLEYFERIPYFQALTEIEFGRPVAPDLLDAAAAQAAELAYLYDTEYVVLTPPVPDRLPYADTWQAAWDFVKSTWPLEDEPFYTEDGIEAYRVRQPAGGDSFRLDLGAAGTFPYRGEGWDAAETDNIYETEAIWATAQASRLFIPLRDVDPAAAYRVRLRVHPFTYPSGQPQTVTLAVNGMGEWDQTQRLSDGWQEIAWEVPGSVLVDGLNRLELKWGDTASPRIVTPGDRQIGSTGVTLPVDADLKAFADGGFIALFGEDGEQIDASAGRRGVNVTVLDPQSGAVVQQVGFDTTANEGESAQLAAMLRELPPGAPVLVASYGDAWAHLTDEAAAALRGIGADVTLEELQNQYFALVGVAGAPPGSAAQSVGASDAFVRVSLNRDRRDLAAAVDWVEVARR